MFEFLRETPINLLRYLPSFLAEDASFKETEDTLSAEHEKQRQRLIDLAKQFFISTATWSLPHYERIYDVTPNTGDSYEQRRNRILLKIQTNQTSTIEFLEVLAERYMTDGSAAVIMEDNLHCAFHMRLIGGLEYATDLFVAIDLYKPAHLGYDVTLERSEVLNLYTGSVMQLQSTRHLTIAPLPDTAVQRIYIGFGQRFGGHERITPAVLERESMDIAIGLRLGYHGLHKVNAEYTEPPTIQNMLVDMPIITGALLFRGGQQSIHIRMPTAENTGYNTGLAIRHSGATSIAPAMHSIVDSGLMVGCFLRGVVTGKISYRKEDMNE